MISANQAREQSEHYFESKLDKEIEMIEQKILYATTQGKNCVYIEPAISTSAKQMLKQLGYKVEYGQQYNESYTNIEWKVRSYV